MSHSALMSRALSMLTKAWFGDAQGFERFSILSPPSEWTEDAPKMIWDGKPLPEWSTKEAAVQLAIPVGGEMILPHCAMAALCSKAWKFTFISLVFIWSFWAILPMALLSPIGGVITECSMSGGLAHVKSSWLAFFLPILCISLALEAQVHAWIMPALVKLGAYRLPMTNKPVPFVIYFGGVLGISALGHADLATTGIFFVKLQASRSCLDNDVEAVWSKVISNSAMPFLPSITCLAMLAWLALAVQLAMALGYGIPKSMTVFKSMFTTCTIQSVNHHFWSVLPLLNKRSILELDEDADVPLINEIGQDPYLPFLVSSAPLTEFQTVLGGACSAENMMLALAEGSRMNLVTFRAHNYIQVLVPMLGPFCSEAGDAGGIVIPICKDVATQMVKQLGREVRRVSVYLLLETAWMVNLQASVLGINKAIENEVDRLTLVSVFMTVIMGLYNLAVSAGRMYTMGRHIIGFSGIADAIDSQLDSPRRRYNEEGRMDEFLQHPMAVQNMAYIEDFRRMKESVVWSMLAFAFLATICVLFLLYAVAKLVALYQCPQGVWNVSSCVSIDLHSVN